MVQKIISFIISVALVFAMWGIQPIMAEQPNNTQYLKTQTLLRENIN